MRKKGDFVSRHSRRNVGSLDPSWEGTQTSKNHRILRGQQLRSTGIQPKHSFATKERLIGLIPFPPVQCDPDPSHMRQPADFISITITPHCLKACVWQLPVPTETTGPTHTRAHTLLLSVAWPPLNFKGFDLSPVTKTLGELVLLSVPAHLAARHIMLYSCCHMV